MRRFTLKHRFAKPVYLTLLSATLSFSSLAAAADLGERAQGRYLPESKASLKAPQVQKLAINLDRSTRLHPSLIGAEGRQQVIVRLTAEAAATLQPAGSSSRSRNQMPQKALVDQQQQAFIANCETNIPGFKVIARTQLVLNAVFVQVDAKYLESLALDPQVMRIAPVGDYELDLTETVPQIGAAAVQALGFDGSGVSVAVLDSGVDYTHISLGGSGDVNDYIAAYGTDTGPLQGDDSHTVLDGQFPNAKVVGGYDFVGEDWPTGDLAPDPDPIPSNDITSFGGHGTHVADIIGGIAPGVPGVAPGTEIHAVKVCASYSTSCSGIALIQGMEYAVDPNGDGDPSDHVDIVNMSLGSNYGQAFDDDLSAAVDAATGYGVLTVASAGNGGDFPFITGTPAAARTALSVAQTGVRSVAMTVTSPPESAGDYQSAFQTWSLPLAAPISGPVQYADGAGGNLNGCAAFAPGALAGKIVLVDRGACNFTLKIANIEDAGGVLGIIGLVAPGLPFAGGDGGDRPASGDFSISGFMISQADADILRTGAAEVTFDPNNRFTGFETMVDSSSRGPAYDDSFLKPEIGAPGASISAASGTGTGVNQFGGTSGAAPMVSGAAALLLEAYPDRAPAEIKAVLMNNGSTTVMDPQGLAPVSRIGGGEARVDRALSSPVAIWDEETLQGGLSFGFDDIADGRVIITKMLRVRNYSNEKVKYDITPTFRFDNDADNGAINVRVSPRRVLVQPGADRVVRVRMTIDGTGLRDNQMNSGSGGGSPALLTVNEYDGYLLFEPTAPTSDAQPVHVPWHILPRKAAQVEPDRTSLDFSGGSVDVIGLTNNGVGTAQNDGYSLLAVSPKQVPGDRGAQAPTPDLRAFGVQTFIVPEGFCDNGDVDNEPGQDFILAFAVNTWERQTMAQYPGLPAIEIDTDQDGTPDFSVENFFFSGNRNVSAVFDLSTGSGSFFFFTEHATNTANTVLLVCDSQLAKNNQTPVLFQPMNASVFLFDVYFGGPGDAIPGPVTFAPLGERYFPIVLPDIAAGSGDVMQVLDFGPLGTNPDELGVLMFTNGDRGAASRGGATPETEAIIFTAEAPEPE